MDYAYRFLKNVKFFYSTLNPASLTGRHFQFISGFCIAFFFSLQIMFYVSFMMLLFQVVDLDRSPVVVKETDAQFL